METDNSEKPFSLKIIPDWNIFPKIIQNWPQTITKAKNCKHVLVNSKKRVNNDNGSNDIAVTDGMRETNALMSEYTSINCERRWGNKAAVALAYNNFQ